MTAKKEESRLKEIELQLRNADLQLKKVDIEQRNQLQKYTVDKQDDTKRLAIGAEREVEATYLQEQNRAAIVQEELQSIQLELDAIQMQVNSHLKQKEIKTKADTEIKKAKVVKRERNTI